MLFIVLAKFKVKSTKKFIAESNKIFDKFTKENVMLPESGKPEHIAPVVSFLASEGGGYVTAATVAVGGGIPIF